MSTVLGQSGKETAPPSRWWRTLALLWLAVLMGVAVHQWHFWRQGRLGTDVMALLPQDERAPDVAQVTGQLSEQFTRQLVVMLGAEDWNQTRVAAQAFHQHVLAGEFPLREAEEASTAAMHSALEFYRPWQQALLTHAQRENLMRSSDEQLVQRALQGLYQPGIQARLGDWASDPLELWPQWWSARAAQSRARPRDGALWLQADGLQWQVLTYELPDSAFRLSGEPRLQTALHGALEQARQRVPHLRWLVAGVPLHAEAAAVRAHKEINTIGWGSLAGVLLLAWGAFRSMRPVLLVVLSLLVGCSVALSVAAWCFGQLHMLTLVFGASLVGVAVDYGMHYFAARQGSPHVPPHQLMRTLMPVLGMALTTSSLAYFSLGMAAFPGLRQMALLSVVGLAAAMMTVMCWFPWLDAGRGPQQSRLAERIGRSLDFWPRWRHAGKGTVAVCALLALALWGSGAVRVQDDVRLLQNADAQLLAQQLQVARLMGLPSPAQFYLVRGASEEEVLQREERLTDRLQPLIAQGHISGYSAVSDWVPSAQRQTQQLALVQRVQETVLAGVNAHLDESLAPVVSRPPQVLTVGEWIHQPVAAVARALWLGESQGVFRSVVTLRGIDGTQALPALEKAAQGLDGVAWVDKPAEISSLLRRYRVSMTGLLVLGHALVLLALCGRFGREAWRAWMPAALASVLVVVIMALCNMPWQLFNVLALMLLLGVSVDYGIFLLAYKGEPHAWLAVVMGAVSTWLSFGLLGLSETPALKAFGSTLMLGLPMVLILAPLYRVQTTGKLQVN